MIQCKVEKCKHVADNTGYCIRHKKSLGNALSDTPFVAPDFTYLVQFNYHYCDEEIIILCQDSLQSNLVGFMQRIGFGHYANAKGPISGKLYHAFCRTEDRLKRWETSFYMDDVSQKSTLC